MSHYRDCGAANGRQKMEYDIDLFENELPMDTMPRLVPCEAVKRPLIAHPDECQPAKVHRSATEGRQQVLNGHFGNIQQQSTVPSRVVTFSSFTSAGSSENLDDSLPIEEEMNVNANVNGHRDRDDDERPMQLEPFVKYKKNGQIGEGTYGKVQMATNRETGQTVAIKTMSGHTNTAVRIIN